jgi:hypothetical protein
MFGSLAITNSTLAVNSASGGLGGAGIGVTPSQGGSAFGGAIFNLDGAATLINDTLAGNYVVAGNGNSASGDDLYNLTFGKSITDGSPVSATVNLTNDILAGSTGGSDLANNAQGTGNQATVNVNGPNLIQQAPSGTIHGTFINGDPLLGPLQNNGGPGPTTEVLPGSPVFANPGTAPSASNDVPTSDQRGVSRGATIYLGAYQATTASQLAVAGFPSLVTAGVPHSVTVTAEDALGKTVYSYAGTVAFGATGDASLPTPATLTNGTGTFTLALNSPGVQGLWANDGTLVATQAGILVTPRPAAIRAVAGTSQQATVATRYAKALQVKVTDAAGDPIAGVTVVFAVPGNGPSGVFAGPAAVATDPNGVATAPALTANTVAGTFTVTASVAGLATPAKFTLTNTPGAPKAVNTFAGTPQSATVGKVFATRLQAQVVDSYGNPVSGVTVTFSAPTSGPGATFAGKKTATAVTGANGVATAPALTANTQAGNFTVTASISGVSTPASFSLKNLAAPAAKIAARRGTTPPSPAPISDLASRRRR